MPCGAVGGQSATGVKAEPSDPKHRRTDDGQCQTVGRHWQRRISDSLPDHYSGYQRGDSRVDVYHVAAGEIKRAYDVSEERSLTRPRHVADGRVHNQRPNTGEPEHCGKLHALGKGARDERRGDNRKGELERKKHRFRNCPGRSVYVYTLKEYLAQSPNKRIKIYRAFTHSCRIKGKAITKQDPQNGD